LDVHVNQFEEEHGRAPTPAELLQIMLSEMAVGRPRREANQFEISASQEVSPTMVFVDLPLSI